MVRFTVLASGSKGNSTVVCGGHTRILVDAGLSCRELFRRLALAGEDPATLDAIIVTHEHQDHITGLAVTARKLGIPVYFTEATHRAWMRWQSPRKQMTYAQWLDQCRQQAAATQAEASRAEGNQATTGEADATLAEECECDEPEAGEVVAAGTAQGPDGISAAAGKGEEAGAPKKDPAWLPVVEYFKPGQPFKIGDIAVSPFTIPHDAADPVGFVFMAEGVRMAVATDLGYVTPNVKAQLKGVDLMLLESNHDLEMLRDGPYPWQVKQRVLSRVGHLSNDATAEFLETSYDGQARYVILGHLSESNNSPELARVSAERALSGRASLWANQLLLASQHESLSSILF